MLAPTTLAGIPVLAASATTGDGIDEVRAAIAALAARVGGRAGRRWPAAARDRPRVRGQGPRHGRHGQPARRPRDAGIDAPPGARRG